MREEVQALFILAIGLGVLGGVKGGARRKPLPMEDKRNSILSLKIYIRRVTNFVLSKACKVK
jgi:hypothetical protein